MAKTTGTLSDQSIEPGTDDGSIGGVSLSPRAMVDSIADWPLHRVIEMLRKKEKDAVEKREECHIAYRYGVRMLPSVIGELSTRHGAPCRKMTRWLSYHGLAIAREDPLLAELSMVFARIRRSVLASNSPDIMDILNARIPYTPKIIEATPGSMSLYDVWVGAELDELSIICGVTRHAVAQLYVIRSLLTADLSDMGSVAQGLLEESERWDMWMRFRLGGIKGLEDSNPLQK